MDIAFGSLIADKAFDPQRKHPLGIYKWRHLSENFFCKIKAFKRIAMRSDKTDTSFAAMIYLGAAVIHTR